MLKKLWRLLCLLNGVSYEDDADRAQRVRRMNESVRKNLDEKQPQQEKEPSQSE